MKTVDAIAYFGNKNRLAKALGITRCSVSHWGENVPALRAYQIEKLTDGKLKAPSLPSAKLGLTD